MFFLCFDLLFFCCSTTLLLPLDLPFFFRPGLDLILVDFNTANMVLVDGFNGTFAISLTAALVVTFNGIGGGGFCGLPVDDPDVDDVVVVVDVETEEVAFLDFFFFQNLSIFKVLNLVEKMGLASPNAFTFLASNFVLSNIRLLFSCEEVFVSFSSDDNSIL